MKKTFDTLKKSEIKKAEAAANKFFGRNDCKVTAYSARPHEEELLADFYYEVTCEICFNYEEPADYSVIISAFLPDRRKSHATVKTW